MRRRDFIAGGLTLSAALALRGAGAQQTVRGAVVIGVDKAGDLPKLNGATAGAKAVAAWLRGEGFEVKLFVDGGGPVKADDLFDAVTEFVERGTLDQLVLYFSGHGFLSGFSEVWMLSGAPQNPNQAIVLAECVALARESAIPSVVLISDACRSRPDTFEAGRVRGSVIFPNRPPARNVRAAVDWFLATLPGSPAYELATAQSAAAFEGIYTSALLQAYQSPTQEMVRTIDGVRVVPNRLLQPYLEAEVARRAREKSLTLFQRPDSYVLSDEKVYIGRVVEQPHTTAMRMKLPGLGDIATSALNKVGVNNLIRPWVAERPTVDTKELAKNSDDVVVRAAAAHAEDFSRVQATIRAANSSVGTPEGVASSSTLRVFGRRVVEAVAAGGARAVIDDGAGAVGASSAVRVSLPDGRAVSVAIRFADGSGTVLVALRRYDCNVTVGSGGVADANYVPVGRAPDDRISDLHAAVATSAQFGVFRIEGDRDTINRNARAFGDRIRVGKSFDPTLGLYAAYAYAQADLIDQVRSVEEYMRGDLEFDLFDVAMLARRPSGDGRSPRVMPFCPLLTQGWSMLRVLQVNLAPEVDRARDYLGGALWTTFGPKGMDILIPAINSGALR
ncbi:caspase family protein [Rhodopseudomonas palustris]|uniref:caspase family protein n=1 Tax=Rhodopseudomonas palustris TaxID=1076 RepID=UPI0020CDF2C9|nr:caspase family protein [Rhodopseudomonas palustris]MCP9629484.1 caspase family protein [Rhodopseudomonas palustris]